MRVVAGDARGRRITSPEGTKVRPTTDRVREAMFNSLTSIDAVDGAYVLDLFAGSGALGIESISRGCAHVTFVEPDRRARSGVERNLENLGFSDRATVAGSTAETFVQNNSQTFNLIFCDPPYSYPGLTALLSKLQDHLTQTGVVVVESDRANIKSEDFSGWRILRQRRYSGTVVTVLTRPAPEPKTAGVPS